MNKSFFEDNKLFFLGIIIAILVCILDLYSKRQIFMILDNIAIKESVRYPEIRITGFFSLVKVWNKGVSFGMFDGLNNGKYILSILNIVITFILFVWLYRNKNKYITIAISLIIGGALGNLIDRLQNDAVADFLDFYISSYHWPAFNVADSVVFIGVVLILFEEFFIKKTDKKDEDSKE